MLFFRHVSIADTSLPGALFVLQRRWHVRHIIKRELLWDPCLDLVGNILPNFFVRRGAADNTEEIEGMRRVARGLGEVGLGDDESIMIFPEGTRFTPKKREAVLKKLAERADAYFLEKARAFKNVLPPRLGGCLALLEENTRACAVFCAHVGFEAASRAHNLMNGALIHKTIRIKLWRIPFELIPKTREARIEWLFDHWRRIDEWIGAHLMAENGVGEKAAA
jgi:1-acyl-sn-glycerol-3-phosphate acyltransferase